METSLRDTIREIVRVHLAKGNLAFGQCLTAVGWVGGTLPEMYESDGMVELPMADVAGGGFVVGAALVNKRPIYIIRYQGFNWYNGISIVNYACKSKEIWNIPCPIFIRSIAMEGSIGPVAGSSHHSLFHRMPGIKIYSPMTPNEYIQSYNDFIQDDSVYYISEHRGAYNNQQEFLDIDYACPDIVLFPISITRFATVEASTELLEKYNIKASVFHQFILKPYNIHNNWISSLKIAKKGIVLDDDYPDGIASTLCNKLSLASNIGDISPLGLKNKSAGFARHLDNLPPTKEEIIQCVLQKLK